MKSAYSHFVIPVQYDMPQTLHLGNPGTQRMKFNIDICIY